MKIGKRYSLGQSPKIAANAVEWRRVLAYREAACVKMCKYFEMISLTIEETPLVGSPPSTLGGR